MGRIGSGVVHAALLVGVCMAPFAAAAPAARVEFVVGNAEISSANGQPRVLQKDTPIEQGDLVSTNEGRVQLRFTDGAYVSLQPRTQFRVDEYRWEGKADGSERGFFSLLKGGLRTITGVVGRTNKRNYQVNTSVATIGIRGTEYKIAQEGDGIIGSVGEGGINVCTTVCKPFIGGESFLVPNPQSQPVLTDKQIDLPPTQPGDPAGGSFQTSDQSTNGPGAYVAGDNVTANGAPVGLTLTGQQTLDGVSTDSASTGSIQSFTRGAVVLDTAGAVVELPGQSSAGLVGNNIFGNDGISAWGAFKSTTGSVIHYAVGLPVDIAPKIATYALTSPSMATLPTDALGMPVGTLTGWNQTVDFSTGLGTGKASWMLQGTAYSAELNGSFDGPMNLSGQCASQSCFVNAQGKPFGPGAQRFGVAYQVNAFDQGRTVSAQGAAMLTQTGAQ